MRIHRRGLAATPAPQRLRLERKPRLARCRAWATVVQCVEPWLSVRRFQLGVGIPPVYHSVGYAVGHCPVISRYGIRVLLGTPRRAYRALVLGFASRPPLTESHDVGERLPFGLDSEYQRHICVFRALGAVRFSAISRGDHVRCEFTLSVLVTHRVSPAFGLV